LPATCNQSSENNPPRNLALARVSRPPQLNDYAEGLYSVFAGASPIMTMPYESDCRPLFMR
jgi:hypothetical protein